MLRPDGSLKGVLLASLSAAFFLFAASAHMALAENISLSDPSQFSPLQMPYPPQDFRDVERTLDHLSYLTNNAAQCGGWDLNVSAAPSPPNGTWQFGQRDSGLISWVEGVPGRRGIPLGNADSGMAWRVETGDPNGDGYSTTGLTYPDEPTDPNEAQSLSTSCIQGVNNVNVYVWCNGKPSNQRNCQVNVPNPLYQDPACLWDRDVKENKPLSEQGCNDFCAWANDSRFQFRDCKTVEKKEEKDKDGKTITTYSCSEWANRWTCSGDWVIDPSTDPHTTENKNCKVCTGSNCRCPGPACDDKNQEAPRGSNRQAYQSFYRHYDATSQRQKLPQIPNDQLSDVSAQVNCYGTYSEYDPMKVLSPAGNCVIGDIHTTDGSLFSADRMRQTQSGLGTIQGSATPDSLPATRAYDALRDPWYTQILGAFSFLKPGTELAEGLLDPDLATMVAGVQRTESEPWAKYGLLRAFDATVHNDAGSTRAFTQWWQNFSNDGHRIFSAPAVRIKLPATWRVSLNALHPISVSQEGDSRLAPIDVQIQAKDDLLGEVAAYLTNGLKLNVREEPVPVVIPSNSPIELRAAAERWRTWKRERLAIAQPVPTEVDALIAKLDAYANDIEKVRLFQSELQRLLAGLLTRQRDFLVGINEWTQQNTKAYESYVEEAKRRTELQALWQDVGRTYAKFTDETNVPWCRTDRFTTPIYSMLDSWYPPKILPYPQNLTAGIPTCSNDGAAITAGTELPTLCIPQAESLTIDFSLLKTFTGAIVLPVLAPTQVRLEVPLPGDATGDAPDGARLKLPVFPQIPNLSDAYALQLPEARVKNSPPTLAMANIENLDRVRDVLLRTQDMLNTMDETYKEYWDSFDYDSATAPTCNGVTLGPLDCCTTGDNRCVHPEMDLLERMTQFTARPPILTKDDLQNQGVKRVNVPAVKDTANAGEGQIDPRKDATCFAEDHVCQALLPERTFQVTGWQVKVPTKDPTTSPLENMRRRAREFTINADGTVVGDPPLPFVVPATRLTPVYDVAPDTILSPTK